MQMVRPNRSSRMGFAAIIKGLFGGKDAGSSHSQDVLHKVVYGGFNQALIRRAKLRNIKHGRKNGKPSKR